MVPLPKSASTAHKFTLPSATATKLPSTLPTLSPRRMLTVLQEEISTLTTPPRAFDTTQLANILVGRHRVISREGRS